MMLEMMEEMFPQEVRWTHPQGGMFLWGILPEMDAAEVLKVALERKVAFVPGGPSTPTAAGRTPCASTSPSLLRRTSARGSRALD